MSSDEFDDVEDTELEEVDPGFAGGGGPAATIFGDDDSADEHGDALAEVDEG